VWSSPTPPRCTTSLNATPSRFCRRYSGKSSFRRLFIMKCNSPKLHRVCVPGAGSLPAWIKVRAPAVLDDSLKVDQGEREAICLAREVHAVAILIDDRKGRTEALRCGLRVAGTIGLLELAARRGLVDFPRVIQRLRQTNARLDDELIQAALSRNLPR